MEISAFLDYGLRFSVHAQARCKRTSNCGIELFQALKTVEAEIPNGGVLGVHYVREANALLIDQRKQIDREWVRSKLTTPINNGAKGFTDITQFDRGKAFMSNVLRFVADTKHSRWLRGEMRLALTREERVILGNDTPSEFKGILLTCYSEERKAGNLWFCIARNWKFIHQFELAAKACLENDDVAMRYFPAEEQFKMLDIDRLRQGSGLISLIDTGYDAEDIQHVISDLHDRKWVRKSDSPDPKLDAAAAFLDCVLAATYGVWKFSGDVVTNEQILEAIEYIRSSGHLEYPEDYLAD